MNYNYLKPNGKTDEETKSLLKKLTEAVDGLAKKETIVKAPDVIVEKAVTDLSKVEQGLAKLESLLKSFELPSIFKTDMPINNGNDPKSADPGKYVPVRLTDGDKFYKAIDHAIASMGGSSNASSVGNNVITGQATLAVTNTAVQVSTGKVMNGVVIEALSTNTASLYIGNSSVSSSNGFELQAGQSTSLAINDLSKLYVVGTAGDKVCFVTTN